MNITLSPFWGSSILVFLVLTAGFQVAAPISALLASLVPAAKIDLRLSWLRVVFAALVVEMSRRAYHDQMACMAAKFIRDLASSRFKTWLYKSFGGLLPEEPPRPLEAAPRPSGRRVEVIRTAKFTGDRLKVLAPLLLSPGALPPGAPAVVVDSGVRYQSFLGFGGAFTESSAEVLLKMGTQSQERILEAYFHPDRGIGYNIGRLHMNSCDFSRGNWSCAEVPGDAELKSFSIERYKAAMLPMVKRAQHVAKKPLTLFASPWSPPAWMKDTGNMLNGGKLLPQYRQPWAQLYVLFAKALQAEGLPLWGFTVQNEPMAKTPWENCIYTHEEERDFVRDYLGPALQASGLDLKLMVWDHNRDDMLARAKVIYDDPVASKYVWGVGYHWYGDPRHEIWPAREGQVLFDNLRAVHDLRPEKHIMMTEACGEFGGAVFGDGPWHLAERYGEAIVRDVNNWLEAWVDWNLILDQTGGPNHVQNLVSAPIIADTARDRVLILPSYYYIGHFSRFVQPGARRILAAANRDALEVTAFLNPDSTVAVIVLNRGDYEIDFSLQYASEVVALQALPHSITTLIMLDAEVRAKESGEQ